jgi:undecaprenyl-diphosphatase
LNILNAIIQGIVQGLTEFLPVSSSGHLSLIQYFTGQGGESGILFTVLLHLGTLLAVFIAFRKLILDLIVEVFALIGDLFRGRFSWKNANPNRRMVILLLVSLLPMAVSVLLLDVFETASTDQDIIVEGVCFLFTSFLLFTSDRVVPGHKTAKDMEFRDALAIGAMQAIAPFPGISRSGSTIATGIFMGLDRKFAVSFSFIMGVPTVLGANLLELKDVGAEGLVFPIPVLLAGMAAALVFGLLAIKMVNWLVTSNKFKYFAWYTLILGVVTVGIGVYHKVFVIL